MRLLILSISFIFLCLNIFFAQEELTFQLNEVSYKNGTGKIELNVKIVNDTDSSISILPLKNYYFQDHYAISTPLLKGLKEDPYTVKFSDSSDCESDRNIELMPSDITNVYELAKRPLIEIPANSSKELGSVKINIPTVAFCASSTYYFKLIYHLIPDQPIESEVYFTLPVQSNMVKGEVIF